VDFYSKGIEKFDPHTKPVLSFAWKKEWREEETIFCGQQHFFLKITAGPENLTIKLIRQQKKIKIGQLNISYMVAHRLYLDFTQNIRHFANHSLSEGKK
jgi:hypothetical protein